MHNYPMNQFGPQQMQPGAMDPTLQQQQTQPGAMDPAYQQQQMHDLCQQYYNHLMQFETTDGQVHDGIIDSVDQNGVNMLIPDGDTEQRNNDQRYGFDVGYGGYGGYPPYGYGYPRRFRRFRRQRFPFYLLRSLFFPYFY
ncbi:hypothetical protein ACFFHM_19225 [Halalkalibacter kiskunsagensis]|uniref:S1 motif domain-containing protein n=1 Tax=Halalkalibacter kiskunsagensis TaxID=1548599 RepID=A0ABV6KGY3_9BACI